ncbi:tripartite tricarboxylate transporter TctB family protein [Brenneria tiliae]|uniref:Tripartite tricarboxylate transporter TctB family protein n=1 Tax=Brenneria tiliae TaxID=2914984 RepID=A0ABT0MWE9_9GAMM|nr:tripartite tricarboxylate transporter TctB family protein [Brenneria tiliae]MCL2894175.1 tripartite tricarboxylate transporter TctB family protein [Brenneria tiliae]
MSRRINQPDALSGLLYLLLGGAFAIVAWRHYPLGGAARMGPGFLPFWLGTLLMLIGGWVLTQGIRSRLAERLPPTNWRALGLVAGSIVAFALALPWCGLLFAIVLMVLVATLAAPHASLLRAAALGGSLALFSALVFVKGLGLPLPLWPFFIG